MATLSNLMTVIAREFAGQTEIKRADLMAFGETLEGHLHMNAFTGLSNMRIRHGYFRVPNAGDIMTQGIKEKNEVKSPRGRKPGTRIPGGYQKKTVEQPVQMITEEMLKTPVRGPKGHFLNREAKVQHYVDQGYVMPE